MANEPRNQEERIRLDRQRKEDDRKADRAGNVGEDDMYRRDETDWRRVPGQLVRKR